MKGRWLNYKSKPGRRPSRFRKWMVKGFMSKGVYFEVIEAETGVQAVIIAKHTWEIMPIYRYGAAKTTAKAVRP